MTKITHALHINVNWSYSKFVYIIVAIPIRYLYLKFHFYISSLNEQKLKTIKIDNAYQSIDILNTENAIRLPVSYGILNPRVNFHPWYIEPPYWKLPVHMHQQFNNQVFLFKLCLNINLLFWLLFSVLGGLLSIAAGKYIRNINILSINLKLNAPQIIFIIVFFSI